MLAGIAGWTESTVTRKWDVILPLSDLGVSPKEKRVAAAPNNGLTVAFNAIYPNIPNRACYDGKEKEKTRAPLGGSRRGDAAAETAGLVFVEPVQHDRGSP